MAPCKYCNLFSLMAQHALIDACSAFVVLSEYKIGVISVATATTLVILYNLIAFGTQWIFGLVIDRYELRKYFLLLSYLLGLTAFALHSNNMPWIAVIMGFSNSLFHVSAGSTVLRIYRDKATFQGLFVAPGAIGLLIGTQYAGNDVLRIILILSLTAFFFVNFVTFPKLVPYKTYGKPLRQSDFQLINLLPIASLLLLVILLRSLIGGNLSMPWKSQPEFAFFVTLLSVGIFAGKILGGVVADRINYTTAGVLSLVISTPFLLYGQNCPLSAILGLTLFQMTMAVTLTLLNNVLNYREGLSFGLTTLMLFLGMVPTYLGFGNLLKNPMLNANLVVLSALLLYIALLLYRIYAAPKKSGNITI